MKKDSLFTIKTTIGKADFRKGMYINILQKRLVQICLLLYIVMISILAVISGVLLLNNLEVGIKALVPLALVILFSMLIPLAGEYLVNKLYKEDKIGLFKSHQTINFYENSIDSRLEKSKVTSKIRYNQLDHVYDTNEFMVFIHNDSIVLLIRKKDINEETQGEVIELLKRNLGKKYKKTKRL